MIFDGLNLHNTELSITAGLSSQLVKQGYPQVAMAGRSNVGKSSLVNSLLGRKSLARVSSQPGKTITVNYYNIDQKLFLVDLPGYGYAKRSKADAAKWSRLTESYFEQNDALKLVLQLVDIKVGLTESDEQMVSYLNYYKVPFIIVATKCDRLNKTNLTAGVQRLMQTPSLPPGTEIALYSSVKNIGRDQLWDKINNTAFMGES